MVDGTPIALFRISGDELFAIDHIEPFTGVPVLLVGLHIAGATFVWITVVWFHINLSPEPDELPVAGAARHDEEPILVS